MRIKVINYFGNNDAKFLKGIALSWAHPLPIAKVSTDGLPVRPKFFPFWLSMIIQPSFW